MDIASRSSLPAWPSRLAPRAGPRRLAPAQAAACLAAICLALPAAASEIAAPDDALLFREIPSVFTASKFEQSASDAPASVSVLTAADIRRFGWRTLAEALGSLRGFYTGYDWAYDFVGVRGLLRPRDWNSRILLLVDGHQVNENVYNQAQLGRDAVVDVGAIERIEVVRGPGSSLYGGSAFFAVVNVITRRGRDFRGVETYAHAGSFGERAFRVGAGDRRGPVEYNVVASAMDRDGQRVIDFAQLAPAAPLAGRSVGADGERTRKLLGTLRAGDWSVQAAYSDRDKTIPSGAYGTTLSDPRNFYDDTRQYVRVAYDGALGAATRARLAASADRYRYRADYRFIDGDYTNSDLAIGSWARLEAALDHRLSAATRITAGLEHRRDRVRQFNYDVFAVNLDDHRRHQASGLYAQLEHALGASLRVNAGVRHDRYDIFGSATSPRLGLIWKPVPAHAVKLLYGSAYRAPNAFELWYADGGATQLPNPGLRPEAIRTAEAVWEARLHERAQLVVSLYHNRLRNLISAGIDPATGLQRYENGAGLGARGLEVQLDARLGSRLDARLMTSLQGNDREGTPLALSNSPRWLAKAALVYRIASERTTLALDARAVGRRAALSGATLPSYALVNATLAFPLPWQGASGALSVYNLLDRRYFHAAASEHAPRDALPQPSRTVLLRAQLAF